MSEGAAVDGTSVAVVYFHGAASQRDAGPHDGLGESGLRLVRHVRPGYDSSPPLPGAGLQEVAAAAPDDALAQGITRVGSSTRNAPPS